MRMPADSLVIALANLVPTVIGCVWLRFPSIGLVGVVSAWVFLPVIFLLTLFFLVRDLRRTETRKEAMGAAALSLLPLSLYLVVWYLAAHEL